MEAPPVPQAGPATLFHALAFQGVWFAAVLGAAAERGWPGPLAAALYLGGTALLSPRPGQLRAWGGAALLGLLAEGTLAQAGVFRLAADAGPRWLAPAWIVGLWPAFAALLPRSLRWLEGRYLLAGLLGALAGPLTYFGAARLGAASLEAAPQLAGAAFALEWALGMPLLVWLTRPSLGPASLEPAPE